MKFYASMESYQRDQIELYKINMDNISNLICEYFGQTKEDLKGKSRKGEIVITRGFVILFINRYLNRKIPTQSQNLRIIGLYLNRDRVTMWHHVRQHEFYISNNIEYKQHHFNLYVKLISNDFI